MAGESRPAGLSTAAFLTLLLIALLMGANHVSARVAFNHGVDVATAVVFRSAVTALVVGSLIAVQHVPLRLEAKHRRALPAIGVLIAIQSLCLYSAVARLPVALALLAFNTYPLWTALWARVVYGHRPERAVLLAMPVMLLAALCIRLESRGPVLYRQERTGKNGRPFQVVKFRSMRVDAEVDGQPRWATADDDRITRVGRFIRRTRIDELPQLLCVLKGDMSLVGPRPERPYFVEQLTRQIPFYAVRHSVKPGVTGWAQVRYQYGASVEDSQNKLQYDLYYVKNHSLLLDLRTLVETVRVVLTGQGAH